MLQEQFNAGRLPLIILLLAWTTHVAGQDHNGPRLVSAVVSEAGATNLILVTFDESLALPEVTNVANYAVTLYGTANRVPVISATAAGQRIVLRVGSNSWYISGLTNYYLTVNHVRDLSGNIIGPDSRIGISWPNHTEVLRPFAKWHFQAPIIEQDIVQQPWTSCDYVESPWWTEGSSPFSVGGPALFRTKFVCPPQAASGGLLRFDYLVESGAVFYLNGVEVARVNLCPAPTPLTSRCCATYLVAPSPYGGQSVVVTNLVAGTNCLAAVVTPTTCLPVVDPTVPGGLFSVRFGLQLWATRLTAGPLPPEDPPVLQITARDAGSVRLSWTGSGFALEKATNLTSHAPPTGSWTEVSDMSNPYTNSTGTQPSSFFRLRK